MPEKRLAILDGYSLLYRAFFATRFLSTADGTPTNALYGFTQMLFHLLENVKPDAVVVALDAPGKTFRHAEFSEYKGTRKDQAPELKVQLPVARKLIEALGIQSLEVTGYEADDVVGTISKLAEEKGYNTTIVTGDLDTLQLVDDCVSVLTMRQGVTDTVTYNAAAVVERYGFGPEFVPDYKALVGDTSDNIPGVPGIGAKGAADLIQKWGTIENLLEHFDEVDPKFQKKITGNEEQLRKSKWLATIKTDAPIEFHFQPLKVTPEGLNTACAMMESLEFKSLVRRAPKVFMPYVSGEGGAAARAVVEVENEKLEVSSADVSDFERLSEFVQGRPFAAYVLAAAPRTDLFDDSEKTAYVAVGLNVRRAPESAVLQLIAESPGSAVLHDAKPTYRRLPRGLAAPGFDTMLAGYVLQSGRSAYSARDLIGGYLDIQLPETAEELTASLLPLRDALADRLEREGQMKVLQEVETPLVPILADMEHLGIPADRENLREFSKELEVTIDQTARMIYEIAGCEFTIGSPKQLGEILFEKMQLPGAQKTKTGYATGVEVLSTIPHPICQEILTWRELSKLKSTYADSLERLIRDDGRIHTTYNQTVAATGRLSSQDPNLQNIPIRTELGRGIRKAFHAADGFVLGSFDYSQIELRVLAHMCGEPALVKAFETGEDVHTVTASQMFAVPESEVTKQQRGYAKLLNYAVLYGVTDFGLAQQLGTGFSVTEAKALITQYNERFPSVKGFMESVVQEARAKGFTTTLLGRRRYFPDIHTGRINERRATERQAMNAPIQGTAADMMKLAMIRAYEVLSGRSSRMLLTVHDELVFELATSEEAGLVEPLRSAMETALPLSVPVEVDAKVGANWNEMRLVEAVRV
jgi:DNA polymerase-1